MPFIAQSLTTLYDNQEDRLCLIFTDREKRRLMGLMTRHLLKGILAQLPGWLTQKHTDSMPRTAEQQRSIDEIHHQISQQSVPVTYGKFAKDQKPDSFLINTINFAKAQSGNQNIRLKFLDVNKTTEIILVITPEQLHKLIGEILKQVKSWDINNPWQEKNIVPGNEGAMH